MAKARTLRLLGAIAAGLLCSGCGIYYGYGPSRLPYQGRTLHSAREIQLGYSPRQFPRWSTGVVVTTVPDADLAAFVEPKCGCQPGIFAESEALSVQHRWHTTRAMRPLATVEFGRLKTGYLYTVTGSPRKSDSLQAVSFVTLRGGGEFSLASALHVVVLVGYRESFRKTSVKETVSQSGLHIASLVVVGRRYRAP